MLLMKPYPERNWKWKLFSRVWLCDPMDYTDHGILQARILEWVAFPFSRGSSQPRDQTQSPILQADFLPAESQGKPKNTEVDSLSLFQQISWPRDQTGVSCIAGGFFTNWAIRQAPKPYPRQPLINFLSIDLPFLDILYKLEPGNM